jgi:hypothetical protein
MTQLPYQNPNAAARAPRPTAPKPQRRCPSAASNSTQAPTPSSGHQQSANGAHETGLEQQPSANGAVEGSVTAAAQALNYAQPSISHHMARLEAETGAKFKTKIDRYCHLVTLNAATLGAVLHGPT